MKFIETSLKGAHVIVLEPFKDDRGLFVRIFSKDDFKKLGDIDFVHINHSVTNEKGAIRGMHCQLPPYSEVKVIRCIKGSVFDVIIDLRENSPTFLKWHGEILSKDKMNMMYVPKGFAHGFQTLEDNCELLYFHTAVYNQPSEKRIRYNDPAISIKWPLKVSNISEKDKAAPFLDKSFRGIGI